MFFAIKNIVFFSNQNTVQLGPWLSLIVDKICVSGGYADLLLGSYHIVMLTAPQSIKKFYRKYYIRNLDPGFVGLFLCFPYVSVVSHGKSKKIPDPG